MDTSEDISAYEALTGDVAVYGFVAIAVALAEETDVIQILNEAQGPLSSQDVAKQGKLKDRYVKELLGTLTSAGLIQLEPGTGGKDGVEPRFLVPPAHRKALTVAGRKGTFMSYCARHYSSVKEMFYQGGPSVCIKDHFTSEMFNILDRSARLNLDNAIEALLKTPGLRQRFENGIQAVEMGSGYAPLTLKLAAMFPKSHFMVTDMLQEPVEHARKCAQADGLTNLSFQVVDIYHMPDDWEKKFDWVMTVNVIHDLPNPLKALIDIFKILRPDGHFSMFDIFTSSYVSENVGVKLAMTVQFLGMFLCLPGYTPDSAAPGPCWSEQKARELAAEAGFQVLGIAMPETMVPAQGVCMCKKPE